MIFCNSPIRKFGREKKFPVPGDTFWPTIMADTIYFLAGFFATPPKKSAFSQPSVIPGDTMLNFGVWSFIRIVNHMVTNLCSFELWLELICAGHFDIDLNNGITLPISDNTMHMKNNLGRWLRFGPFNLFLVVKPELPLFLDIASSCSLVLRPATSSLRCKFQLMNNKIFSSAGTESSILL